MISYLNKSGLAIKTKLFENIAVSTNSLEENLSSINSAINFIEFEEDLFKNIELPSRLKQCNVEDFDNLKRYLDYKTKKIFFLKSIIEEEYVFYKNYIAGEKLKVEGKLKEVKNKISFLGGYDGDVINSLVEDFNNMYNVDARLERTLSVDTAGSVCLLPVVGETKATIQDVKILSSSNGIAGTILEDRNSYISNVLNSNDSLFFEYYKQGEKALKLDLEITLNKEHAINYVEISVKQKYLESNLKVEEAYFIDDQGEALSLFSLIDSSMQDLEIESYNADNKIVINHLPAKTKRLKLFLKCSEPTLVENRFYNVIALKEVSLGTKSFKAEGALNFKELEVKNTSGSILSSKIISYPKNKDLIDFKTKAIFEEEKEVLIGEDKVFVEEDYSSVRYSLRMSKPNSLVNLYSDNELVEELDLDFKQQRFNKDVSPNSIMIPYDSEEIEVYQPGVYERSYDTRKARKIGFTKETITKINLPVSLEEVELYNSLIEVYLDEVKCNQAANPNLVSDFTYYTDGDTVFVGDESVSKNKEVKVLFVPESSRVFEKADKIYFQSKFFIDRDKEKTQIYSFNKDLLTAEEEHRQRSESIVLDNPFVCNVQVRNSLNESVTDRYIIDFKKGALTLKEGEDVENYTKVTYQYFTFNKTNPKRFWKENEEVKGFIANKADLNVSIFNQSPNESLEEYKHYRDLIEVEDFYLSRAPAEKTLLLKSKNVLEGTVSLDIDFFGEELRPIEVEYINGVDEFSDLKLIEKEVAPLMEANTLNEVSFTLRHTPAEGRSIRFYKNDRLMRSNEYSYSLEGRILKVTTSSPDSRGLSVSYFAEMPNELNELYARYSVNYPEGILYSEEPIRGSKELTFSSVLSFVETSVCKKVESWRRKEDVLLLNPTGTSDINSLIKVSWREKDSVDFDELYEFYSPLVYRVMYELRN